MTMIMMISIGGKKHIKAEVSYLINRIYLKSSDKEKLKRKYFNDLKLAKQFKKECGLDASLLTFKMGYIK